MEELKKEFANIIKEIRSKYEFTLQEFGKILGVSDVYVSRIEKGQRFPSKKVLFVILFFLDGFKDYETIDTLLSLFIKIKGLDSKKITEEYQSFLKKSKKGLMNHIDRHYNNEVELPANSNINITSSKLLDKPYYDIGWLLSQKEYRIFFKGIETNNDDFYKNILTEEDKKMLYSIINTILLRIYNK